jgi:hypothetical protein
LRRPHRVDDVAPAVDLGEAVLGASGVGGGVGRIEFKQKVARLDRLAGYKFATGLTKVINRASAD